MTTPEAAPHADDVLALTDLQLGQVVAEAGEQLIEFGHLRAGLDGISGGGQRRGHRLAGPADPGRVVGEDVDVLGGAVDDAVGDRRLPAASPNPCSRQAASATVATRRRDSAA